MSKKLKGIDTHGNFKGRVLIVTHKDLDGITSATATNLYYKNKGLDTAIYYDISSSKVETDNMIKDGLKLLESFSLGMFDQVVILDRESCSKSMAEDLYTLGVKRIIHIDHHITNRDYSRYMDRELNKGLYSKRFISCYEDGDKLNYSATQLAYFIFFTSVGEQYDILPEPCEVNLKHYCALADLYDTFMWTELMDMNRRDLENFIANRYSSLRLDLMESIISCRPLDRSAVNMNYVYQFMGDEMYFEKMTLAMSSKDVDFLSDMEVICRRYSSMEADNLRFIRYAYNDAVNNNTDSRFESAIYNLIYKTPSNKTKTAQVLFIDKPLDYSTSSVAAYLFLKDNPNVILVYRSKEASYSYSVRSTGELSTLLVSLPLGGGGHINASGFTMFNSKEEYENFCRKCKKDVKESILRTAGDTLSLIEINRN